MKSLFDEDGEEESRSDADLTLGIGSLLSIFFGVVLICGIFFGFGYSMGRRNAHATIAPATLPPSVAKSSPLPENELSGAPLKPQSPDDEASPADQSQPAPDASKAQPAATPSAKHSAPDQSAAPKPTKTPTPSPAPSKSTRVVESATAGPSLNAVPDSHRTPPAGKPHAGVMAPLAQAPGDSPI